MAPKWQLISKALDAGYSRYIYKPASVTDDEHCPICWSDYEAREDPTNNSICEPIKLSCGHLVGRQCWNELRRHTGERRCVVCRQHIKHVTTQPPLDTLYARSLKYLVQSTWYTWQEKNILFQMAKHVEFEDRPDECLAFLDGIPLPTKDAVRVLTFQIHAHVHATSALFAWCSAYRLFSRRCSILHYTDMHSRECFKARFHGSRGGGYLQFLPPEVCLFLDVVTLSLEGNPLRRDTYVIAGVLFILALALFTLMPREIRKAYPIPRKIFLGLFIAIQFIGQFGSIPLLLLVVFAHVLVFVIVSASFVKFANDRAKKFAQGGVLVQEL